MTSKFSPSVNIIRDQGKDAFHYLPTNNSKQIFELIAANFANGLRSFSLIGSYGTGKSAFLVALEKQLKGESAFFVSQDSSLFHFSGYRFIRLVGQKASLANDLGEALGSNGDAKKVLKQLEKVSDSCKAKGEGIVVVVDEFGKYLEHAATVDPDKELYFIQELAELVNDEDRNILLLTTLHQNFDAYAIGLSDAQRKEWEKVKGRLKELAFNEPVEQLLYLASAFMEQERDLPLKPLDGNLTKLVKKKRAFVLKNELTESFTATLYPFDPLSGMALTLALQRYGQNERSLFGFLQADEHFGIRRFKPSLEQPYYSLASVYDYLQYNFYHTLSSKYNPDYSRWARLRDALDRVEAVFTEREGVGAALKIVKAIGLLDILGAAGAAIDQELLSLYSKICLGINRIEAIVSKLEAQKIIRFQSFRNRYKIFEGTDIDIDQLFLKAREEVGDIGNLALAARPFIHFDYVPAKAATYETGTPRIFRFEVTDSPVMEFDYHEEKEVDGIVNLIFEEDDTIYESKEEPLPILHGVIQRADALKERVKDIRAVEKALELINDDKVAKRELLELKQSQISFLNEAFGEELFYNGGVIWHFNGEEVNASTKRRFNKLLSDIVQRDVYPETPVFKNEHTNRTSVSSSIHTAKKQYIEALIKDWSKPLMGLPEDRFPAEKAIYFSILRKTQIHVHSSSFSAEFNKMPKEQSFKPLWSVSMDFLASAKQGKRKLKALYDTLRQPPFRLKDGFLEFWMITFLFIKREDFALFKDGRYIPNLSKEVLELLMREIGRHEIKTFNIEGVKLDLFNRYRELTQQAQSDGVTASGFQETAKPFLVFYAQLPKYTQQTQRLSFDAIAFRDTIKGAKELEKTFFEDLPACFGLNVNKLNRDEDELKRFIDRLQQSISELRSAYDDLLGRFELGLLNFFGLTDTDFEGYRLKIQKRYRGLKPHLLLPRQRALFNRLYSKLPDKTAWLNSIGQALLGKQLSDISDEEERLLYDRLSLSFGELDNLLELSEVPFDEEKEEVYQIEITSFNAEPLKRNVILSKTQQKKVDEVEPELRQALDKLKDPKLQQAALIKLIKEML
ncbi:hypothetical protein [Phaeodactylibacter luteus]|uniref:ATP-binding protein n=1 Tax=Phaeodactylibacter luteus TaxID=1564516 RepID=A0A5C6RG03_9BACT|nr:hypothetical protein [Phaeodactylibacter luteus]TXB60611.1 hypothetical protein FRY97_20300 [Phaeodactylibacter luteus]